ncbi:hypothetical protein ACLOJK_035719 [Asimina triloba]
MSSNPNFHQRPPSRLPSPGQQANPARLKRVATNQKPPCSTSRQVRKSRSGSTSSTLPSGRNQADTPKRRKVEKEEASTSQSPKLLVTRQVSTADKISLQDVARERVDAISEWMHKQPEEILAELKNEFQSIHERAFARENREEFLILQKLLQDRTDLNDETLTKAHMAQLQIFVALNTGVQAFLHPNLTISHSSLIEIFLYKRCRNILCQSRLPAAGCSCEICTSRKGFCNQCMCVICSKYDFAANTCRWIGCESCSHWIHTECAVNGGKIGMDTITNGDCGTPEMVFKCPACQNACELLRWVKDVFTECGPTWNRDALMKELDLVSRIFHVSEDVRGRKLSCNCEILLDKLRAGIPEAAACKLLLLFFQELEMQPSKNPETEEGERSVAPQEEYNQVTKLAQGAVEKLRRVANEKMNKCSKARTELEACDRQLADKARKAAELKLRMQHEKKQIGFLENAVKIKQLEAKTFELMADEARREAERLRTIILTNCLKLQMNEAEAKKQYLFEKMKLQESSRGLQDLLKNMQA